MRKLLLAICLVSLCFVIGTAFAGETKQFKFFDFGTYTVPEDFPDKFLEIPSQTLAQDSIANGKAALRMIGYKSNETSTGDVLVVHVMCYIDDKVARVIAIRTVSAIGEDSAKWVVCIYVDRQFFKTGKPSFILMKTDEKLDFTEFKKERELEFGKVRI